MSLTRKLLKDMQLTDEQIDALCWPASMRAAFCRPWTPR